MCDFEIDENEGEQHVPTVIPSAKDSKRAI
jgi:hypothetical protein